MVRIVLLLLALLLGLLGLNLSKKGQAVAAPSKTPAVAQTATQVDGGTTAGGGSTNTATTAATSSDSASSSSSAATATAVVERDENGKILTFVE